MKLGLLLERRSCRLIFIKRVLVAYASCSTAVSDRTGHNIANVNTEGYTTVSVLNKRLLCLVMLTVVIILAGGTYVQDITRIYDQFSHKEQLLSQSNLGNADSLKYPVKSAK